jgi:hypothetical protein
MTLKEQLAIVSQNSSYVANAAKHVWLAELLQLLWQHDPKLKLHIFESEVDDAGFDIVLTLNQITRHIQLKSSHADAGRQSVPVNMALSQSSGGCVVWIFYEPFTLRIERYLFFGGHPGEAMPDMSSFDVRKRAARDASGTRPLRKNIRSLRRNRCEKIDSLDDLVARLFGLAISHAAKSA